MAINKTLFRKVRNKILKNPEAYDQSTFVRESDQAPCGTAACIFGWAVLLAEKIAIDDALEDEEENEGDGIFREAISVLGLSRDEGLVVANYAGMGWPEPYGSSFRTAYKKDERARIAADYINYIIRTGKVE